MTEGCIAALPHRYPANPGRAMPRIRRGRCLHRRVNSATPQTPGGGRNRPPYKAPGTGCHPTSAGPCQTRRRRCDDRGQRRPAFPGYATRMPCIVGRAFTPAGKVCAGPEGDWQGRARYPARYHIRRDLSSPAAGGSVAKMPIPPGKIGFVKPRFCAAAQQFAQNHHTWPGVRCKMEISARMPKNRLTMRVGWGILT